MALTGWPLLGLLLVLCVALPAAALVGWSRPRPRLLGQLAVVLLLIAGQLAAVGLAAAAVNRGGSYYTSWSQVLATFSKPPAVHQGVSRGSGTAAGGNTPETAGSLAGQNVKSFSTPTEWATKGKLESVTITGASSGLVSHAFVYLPPQYFQKQYLHTRFPAAEVFTGYPGNDHNLVKALDYPGVLLHEIAGGRARPMALVMMRTSLSYHRDLECTNVPSGPQTQTFLADDVISAMSRHFRVWSVGWGAIGDSTGGYCAAKMAMTSPTAYRAAVSLSGYYHALQDRTTGDLYAGSPVVRDLNDLTWRLQHLPAPAISLLVTVSKEETGPLGYGDTKRFIAQAKDPLRIDSIISPHGGHNFQAWDALLPQSLDWLSAKLNAPWSPR